jgi:uncharacterized membrane protein HdeD (DUF308 family)
MFFFFIFRGRYGPIVRALVGIAVVVFGIAKSEKPALLIGGVLIVWAIATGISRLSSGSRRGSTSNGMDR